MDDQRQFILVAQLKMSKSVRRVVLEQKQASLVTDLVTRLREGCCRTDSSKIVNQIITIFFQKYVSTEYDNLVEVFFDKRGYLRNLINKASIEDIDASIKEYLGGDKVVKRRKQKS